MSDKANKYNNHEISQVDFIRNHLSTNSMKHFWYVIDESEISTDREYAGSTLCSLVELFSQTVYEEDRVNILSRITYLRNDLWIESSSIALIERPNDSQGCSCSQDEPTIEKCIEFLSSKGYSVTLTRK